MKNIRFFFLSENFPFLVIKFSNHLNRRVLVMFIRNHFFFCFSPLCFQIFTAKLILWPKKGSDYGSVLVTGEKKYLSPT